MTIIENGQFSQEQNWNKEEREKEREQREQLGEKMVTGLSRVCVLINAAWKELWNTIWEWG